MELLHHDTGQYHLGMPVRPANWPHHDLIFVLAGSIRLDFHHASYLLNEGMALLVTPGKAFQGRAEKDRSVMWVLHFRGYRAPQKSSPFNNSQYPVLIENACSLPFERELLYEFTRIWKSSKSPLRTQTLSLMAPLILHRTEWALSPQTPLLPRNLRAVIDHVLAGNLHLSIAEMARIAGVSVSHFRHAFRKHCHTSPIEFLQQARINEAKQLLGDTDLPIKDIGQRIGYGDTVAFHRAFRRETHLTPGTYRRRFQRLIIGSTRPAG